MNMTPTLPTAYGSLPSEGAAAPAVWQSQFRGPCLKEYAAPTLVASCTAMPRKGAGLAWGGPVLAAVAPTPFTSVGLKTMILETPWHA
jgi:hypothetical protein